MSWNHHAGYHDPNHPPLPPHFNHADPDLLITTHFQQMTMNDYPPTPQFDFQPFIPYSPYQPVGYSSMQYYPPSPRGPPWSSPAMSPTPTGGMTGPRRQGHGPMHSPPVAHPMFGAAPDRERKAYHPQAPTRRSDWVMWVGNVPQNTSHEELWRFFNTPVPASQHEEPWRGPSSIFLISRSSCAFVNLSSQDDLHRAVGFFNGRSLRPYDQRCPRLLCRIRNKDDDLKAGVGAQRGTGMHKQWVRHEDSDRASPQMKAENGLGQPTSPPPPRHEHHSSASTTSSFLTKHFPARIFILKSTSNNELEDSVRTGEWQTQSHNEPILDQAFRTSQEVFLVMSANKTGEFFGYAKMVEPIDKEKAKHWSGASRKSIPGQIPEEDDNRARGGSEPIRPGYFLSPSQTRITSTSPGELTPGEDYPFQSATKSNTDPTRAKERNMNCRAHTLDPKNVQPNYFPSVPIVDDGMAERQQHLGGSRRHQELGGDGVLRKDTALTGKEKEERDGVSGEAIGATFKIEWIKVARLPFTATRHLRNPWNSDREVKISRDGTEVEPSVGKRLMAEWDKMEPVYAAV